MSALPEWWRWATGMRTACGLRVYVVDTYGQAVGVRENDRRARPETVGLPHDAQPAPDDPATIGCLTARVREVCNDPTVTATCRRCQHIRGDAASGWEDGPWSVTVSSSSVTIEIASGPTEWSALMTAGDAAWARRGGAA